MRGGNTIKTALSIYNFLISAKDGQKMAICGTEEDVIITVNRVKREGIRGESFGLVYVDETVNCTCHGGTNETKNPNCRIHGN